jgi:peptidoglycan hydrolase-like protein with peptidoglycan-binding domain
MRRRVITTLLLAATLAVTPLVASTPATASDGGATTDAATAAVFVPGWPLVKKGASGHPVKTLQRLLNFRGASPKLAVDGSFGALTDREVRDFQRSHGLTVDGVVGPKTWGKLITLLVLGSTGEAVRAFGEERCFRNEIDQTCPIDGTYGSDDVTWTKAFQSGTGHLVVDGKVGPATWQALVAGELAG